MVSFCLVKMLNMEERSDGAREAEQVVQTFTGNFLSQLLSMDIETSRILIKCSYNEGLERNRKSCAMEIMNINLRFLRLY